MSKILIFGGAFDPPTSAHYFIVKEACNLSSYTLGSAFDEIWVVPCWQHTFHKNTISANERIALCRLQFQKLPANVKIKTYEIDWKHTGSTYAALQRLKEIYPQHEFSLLMGGDNLSCIEKWIDWKKLISEYEFVVFRRPGYEDVPHIKEYKQLWQLPWLFLHDVSSTQARKLLMIRDENVKSTIGIECWNYIIEHDLYHGDRS